jgi:hypothetical protein
VVSAPAAARVVSADVERASLWGVYHVELRKFPHAVWRFNQSEAQVAALVVPWVNEEWIEEGERKWNANEASLTVLEGRELSMSELAMGRGWRNAQRHSQDVTARMLAAAAELGAATPQPVGDASRTPQLLADSLGLALLELIDAGPVALARAWSLAAERLDDASPAQSLALADRAVRSLVARELAVICESAAPSPDARAAAHASARVVADARVDRALRDVASWAGGGRRELLIARRP